MSDARTRTQQVRKDNIMAPLGTLESTDAAIVVGIVEVQGAFLEHKVALQKAAKLLKHDVKLLLREVRTPEDLQDDIDGLIIPGGESTTISLYLKRNKMDEPLRQWILDERHVTWGTCAGMILLSKLTENQKIGGQTSLGIMDTDVSRNFFGRQVQSFESLITLKDNELREISGTNSFHGVFIRAPAVIRTLDPSVSVLATLERPEVGDNVIVAVRQGSVFSTAFHPELSEDCSWHLFFLNMIQKKKLSKCGPKPF